MHSTSLALALASLVACTAPDDGDAPSVDALPRLDSSSVTPPRWTDVECSPYVQIVRYPDGTTTTTTNYVALLDVGPIAEADALVELCDLERFSPPGPSCPEGAQCTGVSAPEPACTLSPGGSADERGLLIVSCGFLSESTTAGVTTRAGFQWRAVRVRH